MEKEIFDKKKIREFYELVVDWFVQKGDTFPWRSLNGNRTTPWEVALGEILLNRVSADRVLPVYNEILKRYSDPCLLGKEKKEELEEVLTPLGLQRKKASVLIDVAELFCRYGDDPYELLRYLRKLKGMGRYTYNAILLFGFGKKVALVDGVIGRVLGRVFGKEWKGKAVVDKEAWKLSANLIEGLSSKDAKRLYYGILDLGRKVCKLTRPLCTECPLGKLCDFRRSYGVW